MFSLTTNLEQFLLSLQIGLRNESRTWVLGGVYISSLYLAASESLEKFWDPSDFPQESSCSGPWCC